MYTLSIKVPCRGGATISKLNSSRSTSVPVSSMLTGVSSFVSAKISSATGTSLTAMTVSSKKSETRYSLSSTVTEIITEPL